MNVAKLDPEQFNRYLENLPVDQDLRAGDPYDCPIARWLNVTRAPNCWSVTEDELAVRGGYDEVGVFSPYVLHSRQPLPTWARMFILTWDNESSYNNDPLKAREILKDVLADVDG